MMIIRSHISLGYMKSFQEIQRQIYFINQVLLHLNGELLERLFLSQHNYSNISFAFWYNLPRTFQVVYANFLY